MHPCLFEVKAAFGTSDRRLGYRLPGTGKALKVRKMDGNQLTNPAGWRFRYPPTRRGAAGWIMCRHRAIGEARQPRRSLMEMERSRRACANSASTDSGERRWSPVQVDAGAHGESQRRPSLSIAHIDRRAAVDEEPHGGVLRAPGRHVQRGAVVRDVPVAVRIPEPRRDVHAEVEEVADTTGVAIAGELGQPRAASRPKAANELRLPVGDQRTSASSNVPCHTAALPRTLKSVASAISTPRPSSATMRRCGGS